MTSTSLFHCTCATRNGAMKRLLLACILFCFAGARAASAEVEFIEQILEPTGGKIQRPKEWYYSESHNDQTFRWTFSKESTAEGKPYETGVRIQTFLGVKARTGKTAEQFVKDFASTKERSVNVINRCGETDQGLFKRICLETEENNYRILYSLFWGSNGLDVVVVSIAGTNKDQWEIYAPIFQRMSHVELIDMTRFETPR